MVKRLVPDIGSKKSTTLKTDAKPLEKRLSTINVEGNVSVTDESVLSAAQLLVGDLYDPLKISIAKNKIKNLGVFKSIESSIVEDKNGVILTFTVQELARVSDIVFEGNTVYTKEFLLEKLKTKVNESSNVATIREDIQFLESLYEQDGYLEAKVYSIDSPKDGDGPVVFYIAEGIIDDIFITGNSRTRDYVILREMDLRPGDLLNKQSLQNDMRKVFNLNYFENIVPEIVPSETPHHYNLKLVITERETSGGFTFGGSFNQNSGFDIFSDLYWNNVFGMNKEIMIKGNFGLGAAGFDNNNSTYQIKFHDPWAFGKYRSFTFRTWVTSGSLSAFNFSQSEYSFINQQRQGFDVAIGVPHSYDLRSLHKVKVEGVSIGEDVDSGQPETNYQIYSYSFTLNYDKRDQQLNPREGYFHSFTLEKGFGFTSRALDFYQADITFRQFIPTFKNQTIALKSTMGYIDSNEISDQNLYQAQYYYVGGSRSVRGYNDSLPFAYGNKRVVLTAEYRFIIKTSFSFYFFADAGYAPNFRQEDGSFVYKPYQEFSSYRVGKGIGVFFMVPALGPIRLDFGIADDSTSRLHFNLGHTF